CLLSLSFFKERPPNSSPITLSLVTFPTLLSRRIKLASSRREIPAQPQFRQPLTIRNGTFIRADMDFLLQIDRQIFRILLFHHRLVLRKNLMIEIQRRLYRRIPVKIPTDWHKHARFARRHRRRGVEDMQLAVIGEKYRELGDKRQPRLK